MQQIHEIMDSHLFTGLALRFHPNAHALAAASPGTRYVVRAGGRDISHSCSLVLTDLCRQDLFRDPSLYFMHQDYKT